MRPATRAPGRAGAPSSPRGRGPTGAGQARASRAAVSPASPVEARPGGPGIAVRPDALHVSAEGLDRLRVELDDLVRVRRPAIVRRVAAARELGDLRENAEYHSAREELGFLDGRVHALEDQIRRAEVVEAPIVGSRAGLGSTLVVEVEGDVQELRLVGTSEADPRSGRISTSSPVGRALAGRLPGEEVLVVTPSGAEIRYLVVEVR